MNLQGAQGSGTKSQNLRIGAHKKKKLYIVFILPILNISCSVIGPGNMSHTSLNHQNRNV